MTTWMIRLSLLVALLCAPCAEAGYEYLDAPNVMVNTASGSAVTIDWSLGHVYVVTLTSATVTFTFLPPKVHENLVLVVVQDGTGLRVVTLPGSVKCAAAVCAVATTTAGKATAYEFTFDGVTYWNIANSLNL